MAAVAPADQADVAMSASSNADASTTAASSGAAAAPAALAVVHQENLQTGTPVVWEELEEGFCCVCEGTRNKRRSAERECTLHARDLHAYLSLTLPCVC